VTDVGVQDRKTGLRIRLQMAVWWICCLEDRSGGGWEQFVRCSSGAGISVAGYEIR